VDIIQTVDLSKHFGKVKAVDSVSIRISKGEIYGLIGLNGAGKTTTMRLLLGMMRPTSGTSFINGKEVQYGHMDVWEKVGYIVDIPYSYPELTVRENLEIFQRLRHITDKKSIDVVMHNLRLTRYSDTQEKHLSSGNAQRLGLSKALLHNPEILILDEPSNGLDPAGIVEIRELLKDLAHNQGVTIFISSHNLGEISNLAKRVGIIHEGRLMQEIGTDNLEHMLNSRLTVKTRNNNKARSVLDKAGYSVDLDKKEILILREKKALDHPEDVAAVLVHEGVPPTLLNVEKEDLESLFLRSIGVGGGV
jgi:ABC-2 type transport system ATP-binding protein